MKTNSSCNKEVESALRNRLISEGYSLTKMRGKGETGVDIVAERNGHKCYIEVIGFKKNPSMRSKDFFEVFFRAISRLKVGAHQIIIALPSRFGNGLNQRAQNYGEAWHRLGKAFPELAIWLVDGDGNYKETTWNEWILIK
jgi:hypothetical protein